MDNDRIVADYTTVVDRTFPLQRNACCALWMEQFCKIDRIPLIYFWC